MVVQYRPRTTDIIRKRPRPMLGMVPLDKFKLIASLCRASFYDFVKRFWSTVVAEKFKDNWHIRFICNEMQKCAERVFRGEKKEYDEIFNVPPGSSKSTICSIMFPAWCWTRMLSARFICCSFSEKLALRLSRFGRDVIKSELYRKCFPEVQLRPDQDTKGEFANTKGGVRFAIGSGTQVMGSHAHFIIIDDPIDPEGVLSEVELERINNWIKEQLSGRKVDKSITVTFLIMQRLHQDDPTARMAAKKKVKHVKIPATTEFEIRPKRLRKYYQDGLMDPIRLNQDALDEILEGPRGKYVYAGQYGQDPVPPGGGMFKTALIKMYSALPFGVRFKRIIRYWDKAGTLGGGAYTVGVKMGLDRDGGIWILDVIRVQLDSFEREKLIRQTARADGKRVIVGLEQEPGSGGKESTQNTMRRLRGWVVIPTRPDRNKERRADTFSSAVNGSYVYILKGPWTNDYIEEMKYFPLSTYFDQIDASSGAFTILARPPRRIGGMTPSNSYKKRGLDTVYDHINRRTKSLSRRNTPQGEIP